ncbi:unnamed protein product [Caenorhabditis auriculariae]|uniref:Uncharacterized protein n=1 Tax=Caenorhabditis auriculariae TaxID=2777116 RepID=A0A8S1GVU2_9PELO|nr:unnamed protein product [Caenorhabditis auriculariae]
MIAMWRRIDEASAVPKRHGLTPDKVTFLSMKTRVLVEIPRKLLLVVCRGKLRHVKTPSAEESPPRRDEDERTVGQCI